MKAKILPSLATTAMLMMASPSHSFSVNEKGAMSRHSFFQQTLAGGMSLVVAAPAAQADEFTTAQLAAPAALRSIQRSRKKLMALELVVADQDYSSVKSALRAEPISDLRKSCSTIIKAATTPTDDKPGSMFDSATYDESTTKAYKMIVSNMEKMDSLASLALRGKKLGDKEFAESYASLMTSLDAFVVLAQNVVEGDSVPTSDSSVESAS